MKPVIAKIYDRGIERTENDQDALIVGFLKGDNHGIVLGVYIDSRGEMGALDLSHFYVPDTKHVFLEEDD